MDAQKVDNFILTNSKFFEGYHIPQIQEQLTKEVDGKWTNVQMVAYKDPTIALIISLLAGGLGIDRFFIGDTKNGIFKLLTCGGLGIWTIVDWFKIMGITKNKNYEKLQEALSNAD